MTVTEEIPFDPPGLLTAMLAVQAEAPTLAKDRTVTVKTKTGGEYSYSYTPLDSIVEQIGPLLVKNGLVWMTQPSNAPSGAPSLKYTLAHAPSGVKIEGEMLLVIEDDRRDDVQALGSAITYARRYALSAVLNLVADGDDDGRGAGGGQGSQSQTCPQCGAAAIIKGKAEYGGGWVCFKKRGGCGAKFSTDPSEPPPPDSPVEKVKTLVRRHKVKSPELREMLGGVGVNVPEGGNIVTFVEALEAGQAQRLAERIEYGVIPTGQPDVPADANGFTHPPAAETLEELAERTLPVADPGVPS